MTYFERLTTLVTVDFHQAQIKWGVRFATLLIIVIVLFAGHEL